MTKLVLTPITSGYGTAEALNANFDAIETAIENTLSRDGSTPNQMEADLDLNGHAIINSGGSSDDPDRVITYTEMVEYTTSVAGGIVAQRMEMQVATASQTVFTLTTMEYNAGSNSLAVYVNGARRFAPSDYTETDSETITFLAGLTAGDEVMFVVNDFLGTVELPDHTHTWSQITNVPDYGTRWPTYDEVTGKPATFTATAHNHAASEITSGRLADARRGVMVQATEPTGLGAGDVGLLWFW